MVKKIFRERLVDKWLKRCVEEKGGVTFKMHPITNAGIPDRIVHRHGKTFYVETKTTGERCTPIQIEMHKMLKKRNIEVYILDVKITDFWDLFNVCYTEYEGSHYKKNPHVDHPKAKRKTYESNRNVS